MLRLSTDSRYRELAGGWLPAGLILFALTVGTPPRGVSQVTVAEEEYKGDDRVEEWKGKTILYLTPHPDDDTFPSGGTLAKLAENGNDIHIVVFTSDNAGSKDPAMTHERLAAIRKREEEAACKVLGIPIDNIRWFGYDDGMLEYADRKEFTKRVAREIRRVRPDAIFAIDPGAPYQQWHKSDHRIASVISVDAVRAARWRLYFPELEEAGFKAWEVPVCFFFYSAQPNYTVDITDVAEKKARASAEHISQFGDMLFKYDPKASMKREELAGKLLADFLENKERSVEKFRRSTAY